MARYENANSVIGEGSIFEGKFYIAGSLRVDGKFEGDIRTEEALVVGETGKVKTNINAKEVHLSGTLIGDIEAKEEVRLSESGRMLGDITTPVLNLSKGVVLKGNVNITGGQKKDPKKIVEEAFGLAKELDRKGIPG
ncbi:MAG: polymer-forming cytoskeletal protein [Leptospiraceae bacterium]|nr:polymer-forming cytoskeletal protein [Leptospiraceae bacterium]MCB1199267.1 polymer-forming cytoskeletal protein [Leptospiraceae bacterium]